MKSFKNGGQQAFKPYHLCITQVINDYRVKVYGYKIFCSNYHQIAEGVIKSRKDYATAVLLSHADDMFDCLADLHVMIGSLPYSDPKTRIDLVNKIERCITPIINKQKTGLVENITLNLDTIEEQYKIFKPTTNERTKND